LAECVDLLLQLSEPAEQLCDDFLAQWVLHRHTLTDAQAVEANEWRNGQTETLL